MTESKVCSCTDDFCKGTDCACKYEEHPLCENIGCEVQAEGAYMTKNNRKLYITNFLGYTCINEF